MLKKNIMINRMFTGKLNFAKAVICKDLQQIYTAHPSHNVKKIAFYLNVANSISTKNWTNPAN